MKGKNHKIKSKTATLPLPGLTVTTAREQPLSLPNRRAKTGAVDSSFSKENSQVYDSVRELQALNNFGVKLASRGTLAQLVHSTPLRLSFLIRHMWLSKLGVSNNAESQLPRKADPAFPKTAESTLQVIVAILVHSTPSHMAHSTPLRVAFEGRSIQLSYTPIGYCKAQDVDFRTWLIHFLEHIHEYDTDYTKDLADLLPANFKKMTTAEM